MDVAYAEAGPYGGLIASGIHTIAVAFRMIFQARIFAPEISMGSPGIDELRWLKPVRPGDTIRATGEILDVRESRSKPDLGIVRYRMEVLNQRDEVVMTVISAAFVLRQPAAGEPAP